MSSTHPGGLVPSQLMHNRNDKMSVPKSLTLVAAVVLGLSTLANAASRSRYRSAPSYSAYGLSGR
jgi:hypothetical protein